MAFVSRTAALFVFSGMAAVACNSSDPATTPEGGGGHLDFCSLPQVCREIVEACHPKDDGTVQEINDCHENAHDHGTLASCTAAHDSCIAKCNAAPPLKNANPEALEKCDGGAMSAHDGH